MAVETIQARPKGRGLHSGVLIGLVVAATAYGQHTGVRIYPGLETSRPQMGAPLTPLDSTNVNWSQYPGGHLWDSYCTECRHANCRCRRPMLEFLNPFAIIDIIFHRCRACHRSQCSCQHGKHTSSHHHHPRAGESQQLPTHAPPTINHNPRRVVPERHVPPQRNRIPTRQPTDGQQRPRHPRQVEPRPLQPRPGNQQSVQGPVEPRPLPPHRSPQGRPPAVHVDENDPPVRSNILPQRPQSASPRKRPPAETSPPATIVEEDPIIVNSEPVPNTNISKPRDQIEAPKVEAIKVVPTLPEMSVPKNKIPQGQNTAPPLQKKAPKKATPRTSLRHYITTH